VENIAMLKKMVCLLSCQPRNMTFRLPAALDCLLSAVEAKAVGIYWRDAARRRPLAETHQWSYMCVSAPVVFAVLGDPGASDHWVSDCSAATENLLLAAAGLDLGAVWVGIYPRVPRESSVRHVLNIPERWRVLCLIAVGHPAENKSPRTRYEANKVYQEHL